MKERAIHQNSGSLWFVGFDIGGTFVKVRVVSGAGEILLLEPIEVHVDAERSREMMLEAIQRALSEVLKASGLDLKQLSAACLAWPGRVNTGTGIVAQAVNLSESDRLPSQQEMASILDLPVVYENDANAAAWGEFWLGAGKGLASMVLLTLGTGIGSGIIIDGQLIRGWRGFGAELGHVEINVQHIDGSTVPVCCCGRKGVQKGCLEAYASCTALVRRAEEAGLDNSPALKAAWANTPPEDRAKLIDVIRAKGDEFCTKLMQDTAALLAQGTVNILNALAPEMVCFGGGMSASGEDFIDWIRQAVYQEAPIFKDTTICRAALGNAAGSIGAAGCAAQFYQRISQTA